jgi:hypothetical protein
MSRWATTALLVMLVGVTSVRAEADKKEEPVKKPVGSWTKDAGEGTITFAFKADNTMKVTLKQNDGSIELDTDYGMSKDGYVFGRIVKVKGGGGNGPSEGDLFSFKIKVDKTTLTISDLTSGKGSDDNAKKLVEGEYKLEKPK